MKYQSAYNEILYVDTVTAENRTLIDRELKTGITILWNIGSTIQITVDQQPFSIEQNCCIFLTEFHTIDQIQFEQLNIVKFNKSFHCIEEHDEAIGCKGILFFGAAEIPKISIPTDRLKQFQLMWEIFDMEMEENDSLKLSMLRVLLQRFIILCLRIYQKQNYQLGNITPQKAIIKEFNYLVEKHYKEKHQVADYAQMLFKSPKTLTHLFKKHYHKSPLQIIQERRLLEAKRGLIYTDQSIQEIAFHLNFSDLQSFSHFFKKHTGTPPKEFRKSTLHKEK